MIEAISNPAPTYKCSYIGAAKLQAISKLEDIFKQNTSPQKASHKETAQMRVEVKNKNPPMTTASPRVKIHINLSTPAPALRKNIGSHTLTPIVFYEEYKYTPLRRSNI